MIGLLFGWVDWYFLDLLASFSQSQALGDAVFQLPDIIQLLIVAIVISLDYGIWLIPAIPSAVYEMRYSHSLWRAALLAILVWCMALLSYYAYYAFMLMFVGLPHLDFMLFSNRHSVTYWADWWPPFQRMIVYQLVEWIGIGVIGGAVVGALSAYLYDRISKKRIEKAALVKQTTT